MANTEIIPHLFREEYRKIVSVLSARFGFDQIEIAEDIASDSFLLAAQTWGIHGLPPNPVAWLHTVAKNKAINHLRRATLFDKKIKPHLQHAQPERFFELDLSEKNIQDSQLRMMFAICDPGISSEAQIGLALRTLCGFGIGEIAEAFLTSKETVSKRLTRAREKLRQQKIVLEIPGPAQMQARLANVLTTIYLLFNEGYYSLSDHAEIRKEFCVEAMRLGKMLTDDEATNTPAVNALLALMCFQASRFDARRDAVGFPVLYDEQDEKLWNQELISQGAYYLHAASQGDSLSKYHIEAAVAFWSTVKLDSLEKWEHVLSLYNELVKIEHSPMVALSRIYALSKAVNKEIAIAEAEKLPSQNNPLYFALLGELYTGVDNRKAGMHFREAYSKIKTAAGRQSITQKMERLFL